MSQQLPATGSLNVLWRTLHAQEEQSSEQSGLPKPLLIAASSPACAQEPCISVQSPCCRMCCSKSPLTTSSVLAPLQHDVI